MLELPAAPDRPIRLERRPIEAPTGQLIARPFGGLAQVWRSGQPRSVHVRQPAEGVHHRGVLEPFELDLRDDGLVGRGGSGDCGSPRDSGRPGGLLGARGNADERRDDDGRNYSFHVSS